MNQVTDFMRSRNMEEGLVDMTLCRLGKLERDLLSCIDPNNINNNKLF
jgi:hypothetical protein